MAKIEFGDLEIDNLIGEGGFATVRRGRWKSRNKTVAIKTFSQAPVSSSELEILKLVDHPNLLCIYGTVVMPLAFCIVTEYVEQGALYDLLHENEFNPDQNLMWTRQIAAVLVAADNTIKICDFGSSKLRAQPSGISIHTTTKVHGTPRWMAPEVLQTKPISKQCDVYSYGIVVWELLTHKIPFEEAPTIYEICKKVVEEKERPPIPEDCSPALDSLLKKCWDPNPKNLRAIVQRQYFLSAAECESQQSTRQLRPDFIEITSNLKNLQNMFVVKELPSQAQTTHFLDVKETEDTPSFLAPHEESDYLDDQPQEVYEELPEHNQKEELDIYEEMQNGSQLEEPHENLPCSNQPEELYEDLPCSNQQEEYHEAFNEPEELYEDLLPPGTVHSTLNKDEELERKENKKRGKEESRLEKRQQGFKTYKDEARSSGMSTHPEQYMPVCTKEKLSENEQEESSSSSEGGEVYDDPQTLSYEPELSDESVKPQLYQDIQPVWAISREEVELLDDELGKGAWGTVTKAWFRGEIVAAKRLHEALSEDNPRFLYKAIRRELDIASNLRHPNLVLFLGAVIDGNLSELIILNELMDSSLRDILAEGQLSRSQIKSFSIDIARALNYLHSCKPQPLIHRDVSSANVLLQRLSPDYWKAKLSDYGSLQAINLACTLAPGNPVYAAPEALHIAQQSCKMDTYSFGVLLIEMVTWELPTLKQRAKLLQEIKWQEMHLLIEACIRAYPDERPVMQQIIKSLEHMPEIHTVQQPITDYVEMTWFLPSLTRIEAVEKLANSGKEGNFLVRLSASAVENKYSLSVLHNSKVYHYRIWQNQSAEFYIDDNVNFQSLEEMIEFYKQSQGGLCTKLCEYTPTKPGSFKDQSSLKDTAWEISEAELSRGPEIAKGQCGYVVAGMWKGRDVAIRVTKQEILDEAGLQFIGDAIKNLKEFDHVNLIRFYGICTQKGPLLVVTELMPRGSLDKYIKQHQELLDQSDVILDMATQICSALKFLERKTICHGDLASRNCLVGERNVVKVADYSLSLYTSPRKPSRTVVSIRWAAPELIVQQPTFTTKSDVWSFGVVMWELWCGAQIPYLDLHNSEVKGKLLAGYRMEKPQHCPVEVYRVMQKCWNLNPKQRPSFSRLHEDLCSLSIYEEYGELQTTTKITKQPTGKPTSTGKLYYEGLETPKSELTFGDQLAKGGCGYMVAGTWKKSVDVAIRITNEKAINEDGLRFLEEAINISKEFQHENLLKLYGICSQEGPVLYIVTELLTRGCLKVYLSEHRVLVEKVEVLLDMATQICSAMKFLESKGIVHKDVAARNCLVGDRNVIKLADFSLPLFTSERATSSNCVPIRWTAPEILRGGQYSSKSDIWSFGVLLWELWTAGQEPYSGLHNQQVADLVIAGHRLEKPAHCPQHVYELMKDCWIADAEQRMSFAALYNGLTSLGTPDDIFGMVTGIKRTSSKPVRRPSSVAVLYDSALEIPKSQLKFGKELASGKYGYMMSGMWKGREVAVRVANDNALTEDGLQFIEEAITAMKKFEHPNLLKLYGLCTRQGALFVVTELLQQQGILLNYIRQRKELLSDEVILKFAVQICAAMEFLEAKGIIHKDLAARNCLIGENDVVKVTDFSLTIFTSVRKPLKTQFPIKWSAPEVLTNTSHSTKSDVWSYGILLWELWSGGMLPYSDFKLEETAQQVLAGNRLIKPRLCPEAVYNLMQQCWQMNPDDRPSFMMLCGDLAYLENPEEIYDEIPDSLPGGILHPQVDKDEERKRLERERIEKEKKRREEARLKNRQKGIKAYKQFGLSSDTQPFFAVEVLMDHAKSKNHLGVTTGETVFVLLRNHPKLTGGLYLVEKEDGTIGYVKKNITKAKVVSGIMQKEQLTAFSKANSGEGCYSVYDYSADDVDDDPYGEVGYMVFESDQSMGQKKQSAHNPKAMPEQQLYSAIYDYTAAEDDEVSFIEGDIVILESIVDDGWMTGRVQRTGKCGMLPSNYVEKI